MMVADQQLPELTAVAAMPDEAIVERVRNGDRALFEVIVRRHNQRMYRVIRSILGSDADVEDVMQQAYVASYLHLDQFRAGARFSSWLIRIAVNEALQRRRKSGRTITWSALTGNAEEEMEPAVGGVLDEPNPEDRASTRQLARFAEDIIDRLPEIYRTVLVLREVEGMDTSETAAALGVTDEVVKTRLHRAKATLRDGLERRVGAAITNAFPFGSARCDRVTRAVMTRILSS